MWITLTLKQDGGEITVNTDHVTAVTSKGNNAVLWMSDSESLEVVEGPNTVKALLRNGGTVL